HLPSSSTTSSDGICARALDRPLAAKMLCKGMSREKCSPLAHRRPTEHCDLHGAVSFKNEFRSQPQFNRTARILAKVGAVLPYRGLASRIAYDERTEHRKFASCRTTSYRRIADARCDFPCAEDERRARASGYHSRFLPRPRRDIPGG